MQWGRAITGWQVPALQLFMRSGGNELQRIPESGTDSDTVVGYSSRS